MSLLRPFIEARAVLGVSDADDAVAVKRAYRKLALTHPPDTDPEGFRRVRAAYELLTEPSTRVREMLLQRHPAVDPPPPPAVPEAVPVPPAALPVVLLRLAAARVDAAALLQSAASASTNGPAPTPDEEPTP